MNGPAKLLFLLNPKVLQKVIHIGGGGVLMLFPFW